MEAALHGGGVHVVPINNARERATNTETVAVSRSEQHNATFIARARNAAGFLRICAHHWRVRSGAASSIVPFPSTSHHLRHSPAQHAVVLSVAAITTKHASISATIFCVRLDMQWEALPQLESGCQGHENVLAACLRCPDLVIGRLCGALGLGSTLLLAHHHNRWSRLWFCMSTVRLGQPAGNEHQTLLQATSYCANPASTAPLSHDSAAGGLGSLFQITSCCLPLENLGRAKGMRAETLLAGAAALTSSLSTRQRHRALGTHLARWGGRVDEQLLDAADNVLAVGQLLQGDQVVVHPFQQLLALRLRAHLGLHCSILKYRDRTPCSPKVTKVVRTVRA